MTGRLRRILCEWGSMWHYVLLWVCRPLSRPSLRAVAPHVIHMVDRLQSSAEHWNVQDCEAQRTCKILSLWPPDNHRHHKAGRRSGINQFVSCVPSLVMKPVASWLFGSFSLSSEQEVSRADRLEALQVCCACLNKSAPGWTDLHLDVQICTWMYRSAHRRSRLITLQTLLAFLKLKKPC